MKNWLNNNARRSAACATAVYLLLTALSQAEQPLVFQIRPAGTNQPASAPVETVVEHGPVAPILALAFSPDGKLLASGGYQEILLWDLANAKLASRIASPSTTIHALTWSADGQALFAADGTPGVSGAVRVYIRDTGAQKAVLTEAKDEMLCLTLSHDGKWLAAGGADGVIRIISLKDSTLLTTLKEHSGSVLSLEFSSDSQYLLSAGADRSVLGWSVEDWRPVTRLPQSDAVQAAAFSPDAEAVAVVLNNPGRVRVMRFEPEIPAATNAAPKVGGKNKTTLPSRFFDCGAAQPQAVLWTTNASLSAALKRKEAQDRAFWKKNPHFYVPCSDGAVKVFNAGADATGALSGHSDWVYTAVLNPEQTRLATAGADGTIKLWNTANNNLLVTLAQVKAQSSEWIFMTSRGFFSASSPELLKWQTKDANRSPEIPRRRWNNPENVQDIIAGIPLRNARRTE